MLGVCDCQRTLNKKISKIVPLVGRVLGAAVLPNTTLNDVVHSCTVGEIQALEIIRKACTQ